jgi:hypothetical protein
VAQPRWAGRFAQVREPGTPGWGPEGLVTYPEGIGGFIVRLDEEGRVVVRLAYYYGKPNSNLQAYGEVSFQPEDLHIGDEVQAWGADDRRQDEPTS